jgi:hypothetical protein
MRTQRIWIPSSRNRTQARDKNRENGNLAARSEPSASGIINIPEKHDATATSLHRFELDFLAHVGGGGPTRVGPI